MDNIVQCASDGSLDKPGRSSLSLVAFGHSDKSSDQISRLCLFCAAQRSRACARHKGLQFHLLIRKYDCM